MSNSDKWANRDRIFWMVENLNALDAMVKERDELIATGLSIAPEWAGGMISPSGGYSMRYVLDSLAERINAASARIEKMASECR